MENNANITATDPDANLVFVACGCGEELYGAMYHGERGWLRPDEELEYVEVKRPRVKCECCGARVKLPTAAALRAALAEEQA
jgi:hypothetical protein